MDDFKNAPTSIAEIKSDKSRNALDWKPRDALVSLLREIDAGRADVEHLIICWRERVPPIGDSSPHKTSFSQAGGSDNPWDALSLLGRVSHLINDK